MNPLRSRRGVLRRFGGRIMLAAPAALLSTPVAGAIGGATMFFAIKVGTPETAWLGLASLMFYGALLGSLIAWPVTCVALPLAQVIWGRYLHGHGWLILGAVAGVTRVAAEQLSVNLTSPGSDDGSPVDRIMYVTGTLAGAAAGAVFAGTNALGRHLIGRRK